MRDDMQQLRDMTLVAGGLIVALILVVCAVAINVDHRAGAVAARLDDQRLISRRP
jgi:acyl-coenzyme A thioesterase PaaI-like protein